MKKLTQIFLILIVFITASAFRIYPDSVDSRTIDGRIEMIFSRMLKFNDLYKIKLDLNEKGITLDYTKLEFDENGGLKSIDFKVNCNDNYSGSASESKLTNQSKFGFFRDYSKTASSPFGTGKLE